ncbi:MAG: hypothetical protein PWP03_265 [Candidatus Woesearchaeota archaeon]|nr:hypothetical protein [Candidatus Woesearchaeota archaeon]
MVKKKTKRQTKSQTKSVRTLNSRSNSRSQAVNKNSLPRTIFDIALILIIVGLFAYVIFMPSSRSINSVNFESIKEGLVNCSVYNLTQGNETLHLITAECVMPYYQLGVNNGFTYAIVSIMNKTQNCSIVPLYYQNYTVRVVDVACLQTQSQE